MALNQLLDAISIYTQTQERDKDREQDLLIRQIDKSYNESQMWIQHSLNTLNYQREVKNDLLVSAANLGIVGEDLTGIKDEDRTDAGVGFFHQNQASLENLITSNEDDISTLTNQIGIYNKGALYAKQMDTGGNVTTLTNPDGTFTTVNSPDGRVSEDELNAFRSSGNVTDEWDTLIDNPVFRHGIAATAFGPAEVLQLEKLSLDVEGAKIKLPYLSSSLKQEYDINNITIDKGNIDVKQKQQDYDRSKMAFDLYKKYEESMLIGELTTIQQNIDMNEFTFDQTKFKHTIESLEKWQLRNVEEQIEIGSNILNSIHINMGDGTAKPMYDLLKMSTDDSELGIQTFAAWTTALKAYGAIPGSNIEFIYKDILNMVSTFEMGKTVSTLHEFSPILEKISVIWKNYQYIDELSRNQGWLNRPDLTQQGLFDLMDKWGEENGVDMKDYKKALQWKNVGLLADENLEMIESAVLLVDRYKSSHRTLDDILLNYHAYSDHADDDVYTNRTLNLSTSSTTTGTDISTNNNRRNISSDNMTQEDQTIVDNIFRGIDNNNIQLSDQSVNNLTQGVVDEEVIEALNLIDKKDYNLGALKTKLSVEDFKTYHNTVKDINAIKTILWDNEGNFDQAALDESSWSPSAGGNITNEKEAINYILTKESQLNALSGVKDTIVSPSISTVNKSRTGKGKDDKILDLIDTLDYKKDYEPGDAINEVTAALNIFDRERNLSRLNLEYELRSKRQRHNKKGIKEQWESRSIYDKYPWLVRPSTK